MPELRTNQEFTAYHKLLGNIKYRYLGTEGNQGYNIKLLNLNDNSLSFVECEWFKNRQITL